MTPSPAVNAATIVSMRGIFQAKAWESLGMPDKLRTGTNRGLSFLIEIIALY